MPRTAIPVVDIPVYNAGVGGFSKLTFVVSDSTNNHEIANDGRTMIVAQNSTVGASSATVISVNDEYGRVGNIAWTLPGYDSASFNSISVAGPFRVPHFNQAGGRLLNLDTPASTAFRFAGFRLPIN